MRGKMCRGTRFQAMLLHLVSFMTFMAWEALFCLSLLEQTDCLICLVLTLHCLGFLFRIMKDVKILLKVLIPWGTGCAYSMKLFGGRSFGSMSVVFSVWWKVSLEDKQNHPSSPLFGLCPVVRQTGADGSTEASSRFGKGPWRVQRILWKDDSGHLCHNAKLWEAAG